MPDNLIGTFVEQSSGCGNGNSPICDTTLIYNVASSEICLHLEGVRQHAMDRGAQSQDVEGLLDLCDQALEMEKPPVWRWCEAEKLCWTVLIDPVDSQTLRVQTAALTTGGDF